MFGPAPSVAADPVMGLAYQPYVGQWSQQANNPFAPDRFYTPSFNTYAGGIDIDHPEQSLLTARREVDLRFDLAGQVSGIAARGTLTFNPNALRGGTPEQWSRTWFRFHEGTTAKPASHIEHQASVYRQLAFLVQQAKGAPLTLATYGSGFQAGYWRTLNSRSYAALPVWTDNRVNFIPANGAPNQTRAIDEIYFYFPPTAAYVKPAPERVTLETTGAPGRDLALQATHLTVFEPARKGAPDARLNPGFFAGDANGQIALAAAEINAQAGKRLLTIKAGVENVAVDGSLVNDRMRFAILAALAQAQVANARYPGTVTHLIISNEYGQVEDPHSDHLSSTGQITEMVRFAKTRMASGGDFAGLNLRIGVRGHSFRAVDPKSTNPAVRRFSQDVAALVKEVDFLMENLYPSPEAVAAARTDGHWDAYFAPDTGELNAQWRQFQQAITSVARGREIELMIGETGHPTKGIAFNLPGYPAGPDTASADSAFAVIARAVDPSGTRIGQSGIKTFREYFNEELATAFLTGVFRWSRETGVQIHVFEAFDEPQKFVQNLPLPGLTLRASTLNHAGSHGAEGFYGLFAYTGVADFQVRPQTRTRLAPGSKLMNTLPAGLDWTAQFDGRFHAKLPGFDFARTAASFTVISH